MWFWCWKSHSSDNDNLPNSNYGSDVSSNNIVKINEYVFVFVCCCCCCCCCFFLFCCCCFLLLLLLLFVQGVRKCEITVPQQQSVNTKCRCIFKPGIFLPHKVETQYVHCRLPANCFLFSWRNPAEWADDRFSFITKGSIYCNKPV